MLDYKSIITKHYALGMSGREIAETLPEGTKAGVNKFLAAFRECKSLSYPLPEGITNYGIAAAVYGANTSVSGRDLSYEMPDYEAVARNMSTRQNMTLVVLWNRYAKRCRDSGLKFYSYRQFCENYAKWCAENKETLHFNAVIGQQSYSVNAEQGKLAKAELLQDGRLKVKFDSSQSRVLETITYKR